MYACMYASVFYLCMCVAGYVDVGRWVSRYICMYVRMYTFTYVHTHDACR